MADEKSDSPGKAGAGPITFEELIRSQLEGKSKALELYDAILWKIRSGYIVVLYGLLTVLTNKESNFAAIFGITKLSMLVYVALAISGCALLLDGIFLMAKLRVVDTRNRLSDMAFIRACGRELTADEKRELRVLLYLSGEKGLSAPPPLILQGLLPILVLYGATPLVLLIVLIARW